MEFYWHCGRRDPLTVNSCGLSLETCQRTGINNIQPLPSVQNLANTRSTATHRDSSEQRCYSRWFTGAYSNWKRTTSSQPSTLWIWPSIPKALGPQKTTKTVSFIDSVTMTIWTTPRITKLDNLGSVSPDEERRNDSSRICSPTRIETGASRSFSRENWVRNHKELCDHMQPNNMQVRLAHASPERLSKR